MPSGIFITSLDASGCCAILRLCFLENHMQTVEHVIADLARQLESAKERERAARAERLSIQSELMESIPQDLLKNEGS